jgi:hypothetical protein
MSTTPSHDDDESRVTHMIAVASVDPAESLRSYKLLEAFHSGSFSSSSPCSAISSIS